MLSPFLFCDWDPVTVSPMPLSPLECPHQKLNGSAPQLPPDSAPSSLILPVQLDVGTRITAISGEVHTAGPAMLLGLTRKFISWKFHIAATWLYQYWLPPSSEVHLPWRPRLRRISGSESPLPIFVKWDMSKSCLVCVYDLESLDCLV